MAGEFADLPSKSQVDVGDGLSEFLGLDGEEFVDAGQSTPASPRVLMRINSTTAWAS